MCLLYLKGRLFIFRTRSYVCICSYVIFRIICSYVSYMFLCLLCQSDDRGAGSCMPGPRGFGSRRRRCMHAHMAFTPGGTKRAVRKDWAFLFPSYSPQLSRRTTGLPYGRQKKLVCLPRALMASCVYTCASMFL